MILVLTLSALMPIAEWSLNDEINKNGHDI